MFSAPSVTSLVHSCVRSMLWTTNSSTIRGAHVGPRSSRVMSPPYPASLRTSLETGTFAQFALATHLRVEAGRRVAVGVSTLFPDGSGTRGRSTVAVHDEQRRPIDFRGRPAAHAPSGRARGRTPRPNNQRLRSHR